MTTFSNNQTLLNQWHVAANETELDRGPLGRTILNQKIVIYRDPDGHIVAAPDRCPHREAPLSLGSTNKGVLTCMYHGWSFGTGGHCVSIPSADADFPIPGSAHLHCMRIKIVYGLVWICLGDKPAELPVIKHDDDDRFRRINNPVQTWKTSATRMTDNFLDLAHFPYVHSGTFGSGQRTRVKNIKLEMLDDNFYGYRYDVEAENPDSAIRVSGKTDDTVNRSMSTGFYLPFTVRSTIAYETGVEHIILLLTTPIDDVNSYFTFVVWRNDDFSISAEDIIAFDRMIGAEDKVMLESIPGVLPLTMKGLASTQSDKASSLWRRRFGALLENVEGETSG
jgi:phenylpropionate dioxygenase-like ring-hydroxylating dioxygenase large terminal subunit